MPSFWTHASFAWECHQLLTQMRDSGMPVGELSHAILTHPHAFYTGMQGPDLFFFYPPTAVGRIHLSSLLHTQQTPRLLCCLLETATAFPDEDRPSALSYACGFLGHYLLDSHTHPFVYARSGTDRSFRSLCTHNALESDLDGWVVKRSLGIALRHLPRPQSYQLTKKERRILSSLFSLTLKKVWELSLSPALIGRAFASMHIAVKILYDAKGRKSALARFLERPLSHPCISPLFLAESRYYPDPANLHRRRWIDPYTKKASHANFFELYDRALMRFLPLLCRLESPALSPHQRRLILERLCKRDFHGEPI